MPSSRQFATPFGRSLEAHLKRWRVGIDGSRDREWKHWSDGIYPAYRTLAEEVVRADAVKLHRHAAHVRSSQMFAFNLFLPFREGGRERLSDRVSEMAGAPFRIDAVRFEWVPRARCSARSAVTGPLATSPPRESTLFCGGGWGAVSRPSSCLK